LNLDAGIFLDYPKDVGGHSVLWTTTGFFGAEKGFVEAFVDRPPNHLGTATFYYDNRSSGENTCTAVTSNQDLTAKCNISQGAYAGASYIVCLRSQSSCSPGQGHTILLLPGITDGDDIP